MMLTSTVSVNQIAAILCTYYILYKKYYFQIRNVNLLIIDSPFFVPKYEPLLTYQS